MERIIIIHWNKSTGPQPLIQYPPAKSFPSKDLLLKIWARHELNKEESIIEVLNEGNGNFYTSIIQNFESELYFLIIEYQKKSQADSIMKDAEILASIGRNLIQTINTNKITRVISEAFTTIKNYKREDEVIYLNFFTDKIKSTILAILRGGPISKHYLIELLKQNYGFSITNIDLILISFIKENLIIKKKIAGLDECYFLVKDIVCLRIPPGSQPYTIDLDDDSIQTFSKKLHDYFLNYDPTSDAESKTLLYFLMEKDVYTLIKRLRDIVLSVNDCLNILSSREELFNELIEENIIYETKGNVILLSDLRFIKFTPFYIIKNLLEKHNNMEISADEYLTHLKLMMEEYDKSSSYINYEII